MNIEEIKKFHEDVEYLTEEFEKILNNNPHLKEDKEYGFQLNAIFNIKNKNKIIYKLYTK